MQSHLNYLKRFALGCVVCVCVTAMGCGAALVNANSRELALGHKETQAGFQLDKQTVTFFVEQQRFPLPNLRMALFWARLAPAPVGCLVSVAQAIGEAFGATG